MKGEGEALAKPRPAVIESRTLVALAEAADGVAAIDQVRGVELWAGTWMVVVWKQRGLFSAIVMSRDPAELPCHSSENLNDWRCILDGTSASENLTYLQNPVWWAGMSTLILGQVANFAAVCLTVGGRSSARWPSSCTPRTIETIVDFLEYALKPAFLLYCLTVCILAVVLAFVVVPKHGRTNPVVYISIASIVGSVSVMFVKGFSLAVNSPSPAKTSSSTRAPTSSASSPLGPSTMGVGMRARSPQLPLPRVNPFGGTEPLSAGGDRDGVGLGLQSLLERDGVLRRERYRDSKKTEAPPTHAPARPLSPPLRRLGSHPHTPSPLPRLEPQFAIRTYTRLRRRTNNRRGLVPPVPRTLCASCTAALPQNSRGPRHRVDARPKADKSHRHISSAFTTSRASGAPAPDAGPLASPPPAPRRLDLEWSRAAPPCTLPAARHGVTSTHPAH
ncbi:hypothetical protein B0H14DRAFT_3469282 [Mycena olivaceomarginata]|nr:hypothetical protein B0H14DRAFT_3469282 [Mycena olivaceomarginata]